MPEIEERYITIHNNDLMGFGLTSEKRLNILHHLTVGNKFKLFFLPSFLVTVYSHQPDSDNWTFLFENNCI